ncbi:hypothetical protein [Oceanobacillus oncorhynchi]|uniref:hypothetical protein n=1 Tax=Oceanobacillus oncorhynchi TaxID=545501 RepID=UPI00186803EA|nr:hypothetical protein [Oceanobacillus oncorhynchi]
MEQKQPNKDYINHSLVNQLAEASMKIAERDATITEQYQQIGELNKELEELRQQQIDEMDKAAEQTKKNNKEG